MKKIFDIVTRRHLIFLIISIIFALPFISFTPFVKTVDNVDYFTLENDPDVEFYDKFKELFGNDEFFIIAFEKDDIFTTENLTLLQNITDELEDIDDIREVKSLANVDDTIILNFGIMGIAGIPLNTATALIAAVALGIAVDDTIHFLTEYKEKRTEGASIIQSVKTVIFLKGRAILSSSLILCIGFGVLVLSRFVPTMNFGMLSAVIMITAVIGDLVVLPSIILCKRGSEDKKIFYRKERQESPRKSISKETSTPNSGIVATSHMPICRHNLKSTFRIEKFRN